jgi:Uma2 family endonuclease
MTTGAHPWWQWTGLLATWRELDVPEGWRAEIIEGGIVMTPPPGNQHSQIADVVHRQFARNLSERLGVFQRLGVAVPSQKELYAPDICVMAISALSEGANAAADQLDLAVEIAS